MKRKLKQWTAVLCLLMLLAASLHLARAESAPAQEECAPYRIVLTAPGGWNRSNSAVITVNVKDEQNLGWYQFFIIKTHHDFDFFSFGFWCDNHG